MHTLRNMISFVASKKTVRNNYLGIQTAAISVSETLYMYIRLAEYFGVHDITQKNQRRRTKLFLPD